MALPKTGGRSAAVVMVEFDPVGATGVFTNWCGAKNFSLSIQNEIQSEKVGDCNDWSLPVVTVKEYSGQDITASMDATWTGATHQRTSAWALNQLKLNVRIHFPGSEVGEVEYYDGLAMLSGLDLGEIGNVDGNKISESISLEFDGKLTVTAKA
jgi:Phage tail tube protein